MANLENNTSARKLRFPLILTPAIAISQVVIVAITAYEGRSVFHALRAAALALIAAFIIDLIIIYFRRK